MIGWPLYENGSNTAHAFPIRRRCTMADGRVRPGVAERALLRSDGGMWSGMHLTGIGVVRDYEPGPLQLPIV